MTNERSITETFLLTLLTRLEKTSCVVVLVRDQDGAYNQHVANFETITWADVIGSLEILKYDLLNDKIQLVPSAADGTALETSDEDNE